MKTPARGRLRQQARPIVDALPPRAQRAVRKIAGGAPKAEVEAAAEALARAERQRDQARQKVAELRDQVRQDRRATRVSEQRARANATRWARAYQHLVAIVQRTSFDALGTPSPEAPYSADTLADRRAARRLVRWTVLTERIIQGAPLEDAVADAVRELVAGGENAQARALAQSLERGPATGVAGHLGSGINAALLGWHRLAWASFAEVPDDVWRRTAADEYFRAGFAIDREAALDAARRMVEDRPDDVPAPAWLVSARRVLVAGERELARELYVIAEQVVARAGGPEAVDEDLAEQLSWLGRWLGESAASAPIETAQTLAEAEGSEGRRLSFAMLDYKLPEHYQASTNIGDHVQTVAAIGHLVRHQGLRFSGADPDLDRIVTELQQRVRPELRIDSAPREVSLVAVQRDASNLDDVPPGTWAIWFGWHMKETSDGFDFPPHPHLRPIIVSFHCKHSRMLTPETIDFLRTYGPIGCRDWSTVDLLLSAGVPAFFSGCITTTTSTVFPPLATEDQPGPDAPPVYVEVADTPADALTMTHAYPEVREAAFDVNLRRAVDQLEHYRREHSRVVSSRLHCYLPSRSIGVPADFRPFHPADLRYEGLVGIDDDEFDAMRRRLLGKLEAITSAIVEGRSEAEVYEAWRAICAEDVAAAERRRQDVPPMPAPWFDVAEACRAVRAGATTIERQVEAGVGPEVHIAHALDENLTEQLHVVTAAMVENSSRPLHLWILCRGHAPAVFQSFADTFPEVTVTWLPCDGIDYGAVGGLLGHTTASTMDRLLLPDLLAELPRVVYVDIDTLPVGDISSLHDWDLAGAPLAARSAVGSSAVTSGFADIVAIATRLNDAPGASHDLVRRMGARFPYDFDAFNAGILVLDLERMRADDFCRQFLPYVERYGMNDQEVLNCYAGPHRAALPDSWNAQPSKEIVTDPQLIHWTGKIKPWSEQYVALQELWDTYVEHLRRRRLAAAEAVEA